MMLGSGLAHSIVNAVLKSGPDKLSTRALIDGSSAILLLPLLPFVALPAAAWPFLMASLVVHTIYLIALVKAFEAADMSSVYPVMRGIAPLLSAMGAVVFLGDSISLLVACGIALVSAGIAAVAFIRPPSRVGLLWAALTGFCIASYTIIDAAGVRAAPSAASYIVWSFVLLGGVISVGFASWRGKAFFPYAKSNWRPGVIAGALSVVTYGLALWAYRLGEVPELAALRETSILFGIIIAGLFLKEKIGPSRIIAGALIFAGSALLLS